MSEKKHSEEKDDHNQICEVVTAIDTFTASDYLVNNSMDNVEGMLKLLMNNPNNLAIFKYPNDTTQRGSVKTTIPRAQKLQRKETAIIRTFSADSMIKANQQFMRNSVQDLKYSRNIEPQTTSSSISTPHVFIVGPIRVQTVEKIDGRTMNKLFIDEILELYGSGVKYPSKELISVKPKILKSIPATAKNIPITVQTVWIGKDYVRIDRKIEIDRSKMKFQQNLETKEMVEFGDTERVQENQALLEAVKPIWKSKSEATILHAPIFNLIGSLIITAFQNTIHDVNGSCKIYEEIELRTNGSIAKPEITIIPFLRKVSVLPKNEQIPVKYQEDIFIGPNVMLIKRLIEIKPDFKKQLHDFTLSEERNYATDKTVCSSTISQSITSNIVKSPKMLILQELPIRTDLTVTSSSSSAEQRAFNHPTLVHKKNQKSRREESLKTSIDSSEIINEGRNIIKTFDKFQVVRNLTPINKPEKADKIAMKTKQQAHSDSLHTALSFSMETMKIPTRTIRSRMDTNLNKRKRSKESIFLVQEKKQSSNKKIDLSSEIEKVCKCPFSPTIRTARPSIQSQFHYSPMVFPSSQSRSVRLQKKNHKFIPNNSDQDNTLTALLPEELKSSSSSSKKSVYYMDQKKEKKGVQKIPSNLSISNDQTFKSSQFFGTTNKKGSKKFHIVPTMREIPDQTFRLMKSRYPETDEQIVTAHELSQEMLNVIKSSKKDKQNRFSEVPGYSSRSAKITSHKIPSSMQQIYHGSFTSSKAEMRKQKFCADVSVKSGKSISQKDYELSNKRKYGLLPPTPSFIASPKQQPSRSDSKEKSNMSREKFPSEIDQKVQLLSKKAGEVTDSSRRFTPRSRSLKSRRKKFTKRSRIKRSSSVNVTQTSDDTKSSDMRTPTKWFEKSMNSDQSEMESKVQKKSIVIPITCDISQISSSDLQKSTNVTEKISSVSNKLDKKESEVSQAKKTSIVIESKDEENLTVQLEISLQVKNKANELNADSLKPECILVKGREVYRKRDGYQL